MSEELAEILGDEVNVIIDLPERELVELDEIPGEGVLVRKKEVIKFKLPGEVYFEIATEVIADLPVGVLDGLDETGGEVIYEIPSEVIVGKALDVKNELLEVFFSIIELSGEE